MKKNQKNEMNSYKMYLCETRKKLKLINNKYVNF